MASTTLNEIVLELQEQNRTLDDVKDSIKAMLREDIMMRKKEERAEGDKREAELEARAAKAKIQKGNKGPATSFKSGLISGLGLDGILDGVSSFGIGLGGASIGGLIGTALGRLFPVAVGAILGDAYFDKWIDPLVDRMTGDDATWTMFGQEIDASRIVSGFAGALAVIFGKDALIQAAKGIIGIGDDTKMGNFRKRFVRRLGLASIGFAMSDVIGDALETASGGVVPSDITSTMINGMSMAMMFMPGGPIIRILAGLAIGGGMLMLDFFKKKREEQKKAFEDEVARVEQAERLNEQSDAMLIAKAQTMAEDAGKTQSTGAAPKFTPAQEEAYLRELRKRSPREEELAHLKAEIAFKLAEAKKLSDNFSPAASSFITGTNGLIELLQQYKYVTGRDHPASAEVNKIREKQSKPADDFKIDSGLFNQTFKRGSTLSEKEKSTRKFVDTGQIIKGVQSDASGVLKTVGQTYGQQYGYSMSAPTIIGNIDNSTTVVGGGQQPSKPTSNAGSYGHAINTGYIEKRVLGGGGLFMIPGSIGIMPSS